MKESKFKWNSWPLGRIPRELQRPELDEIKNMGYEWDDPRDVVILFEEKVAKYTGSKYAVSCDCCSNGIFLTLKYLQYLEEIKHNDTILIPKKTYISVPMQIIHSGLQVDFEDLEWFGINQLKPTRIYDCALRFTKNMYVKNTFQILSFQIKKRLPIGKGGMILTDSKEAYEWLKLASYDGRDLTLRYDDPNHVKMIGYHMYMTPEDAARGIIIMDSLKEFNDDIGGYSFYNDVSIYFEKNKFIK